MDIIENLRSQDNISNSESNGFYISNPINYDNIDSLISNISSHSANHIRFDQTNIQLEYALVTSNHDVTTILVNRINNLERDLNNLRIQVENNISQR